MAEETTLLQMPVEVSTWNDLLQGGFFFVDKTALLKNLFLMGNKLFLTRPRRMGKTLLCSMLQEWFTNGSKSFAGLAIDGMLQEEGGYPVINLSFFELGNNVDAADFESSLCKRVIAAYSHAGFNVSQVASITSFEDLAWRLDDLAIERGKPLVFLIDEWDYPLSINLHRPQVFAAFQKVLRDFYGWLRLQPRVRFILVTGIMRYRETSLFTGQNVTDISMEPDVANLLGYTQADITSKQFAPYINGAAKLLGMTPSAVLDKLELYYDGFCFDHDASVKVYCPFAVNSFFAPVVRGSKPVFRKYWMKSSDASAALISYLHNYQLSSQKIMELSNQELIMPYDNLSEGSYLQNVTFEQILVLGGYFSIKEITDDTAHAEDAENRKYRCGITNQEVKDKLYPVLMSYVVSFQDELGSPLATALNNVKAALRHGDIAQLCFSFNEILSYVRYDAYKAMASRDKQGKASAQTQSKATAEGAQETEAQVGQETEAQNVQNQGEEKKVKPEPESFYRTLLKLALCSESIMIEDEVANKHGRSDLEATTKNHFYIFELKRLEGYSEATIKKRLDDGEKQILSRMYGNNRHPELPKTMVVLVISDTFREICGWRRFKVQRIAQELVVVERHDELLAVVPQAYESELSLVSHKNSTTASTT